MGLRLYKASGQADRFINMSWVRILRGVVLASIALGALLGVVVLLGADIGDPGWKVITTSFLITGAALVAMPSVAAWERERLGRLPLAGVAAAVVGFAWMIVGIWFEFDADFLWKIPATLIIAGIAIAGVALMEFARLEPRQQWLLTAVRFSIGIVALVLVVGIWGEISNSAFWRAFGVAVVLMTAFVAAVPVLHRSARSAGIATRFCPLCGAPHGVPGGIATVCPECGRRYQVVV